MTDEDLLRRMMASRMRLVELQARGSREAQRIRSEGVRAVVSPATPARWDLNCAAYTDAASLAKALPMLDEAFAAAGVEAWGVRVPEPPGDLAGALHAAGLRREARAYALGRELDDPIARPAAPEGIRISRAFDLAAAGRINDVAHGDRPGEWAAALGSLDWRRFALYTAVRDGTPVSVELAFDHRGDAVHSYLATLPSARGLGLGRLLKLTALADARERGCTTATSHSTAGGAAVARACGYRVLAPVTAWVRRFESRPSRAPRRGAREPASAGGR